MYAKAKPFLKWAGGKSQILREIEKFYPKKIEKYCEPFIGGGAVLFDILAKFQPREVLINDINPELTNTYYHIRDDIEGVISILENLQSEHLPKGQEERKALFLEKREKFNTLIKNNESTAEKAALMIYLNKTCFNGLYRVNSKGFYNVPSGAYKNPLICDYQNLRAVSVALQSVQIKTGSYKQTKDFIDNKTFVYIDPPYRPLTDSSSFTAYSQYGFNDAQQIELSNFVAEIHEIGAKVLLSNSDPKNSNKDDDFFDDLYQNFEIYRVHASRMINSNARGRSAITELMVACF